MKFLVPNYSCFQNPWLGATAHRSPFSLSSVLNWICWTPPPNKILGYATGLRMLCLVGLTSGFSYGLRNLSVTLTMNLYMNNRGCSRIPSLKIFSSLLTAEPAAGFSTGVASRFATEVLKPGQPGSFPSLSTCQVSFSILRDLLHLLQIVSVLQPSFILIYVIKVSVKQSHYRPGVAQRVPGS